MKPSNNRGEDIFLKMYTLFKGDVSECIFKKELLLLISFRTVFISLLFNLLSILHQKLLFTAGLICGQTGLQETKNIPQLS